MESMHTTISFQIQDSIVQPYWLSIKTENFANVSEVAICHRDQCIQSHCMLLNVDKVMLHKI